MNFQFSDSFFECSSEPNISICDHDSSSQPDVDIFDQLCTARKKGGRALRGYFGPPMRSKNKSCSSQVSSY